MPARSGGAPDVIVVGGGFAGLSAATALAEGGARVVLVEARPHLGGRARSWIDPTTGGVVDNGQHLFMGCYDETLRFLERIGTRDRLAIQPRLEIALAERDGSVGWFRLGMAPGPLGAILGLLGFPRLGWRDRLRLLRVARAARRAAPPGPSRESSGSDDPLDRTTVASWLAALGQSPETRRRLWDPLAIAVLNESPDLAAASGFAAVLHQALQGGGDRSGLGLSQVGLSDLYAEPAARFLKARGGEVRLRSPVLRLLLAGESCAGVVLAGGERLPAGRVIAALPPRELLEILPPPVAGGRFFEGASRLPEQSIVSVYLWFGTQVTDLDFAGLLGCAWQWLFTRGALAGAAGTHHVTLVRSAAGDFAERPKEAIVRSALEDLRACFPAVRRTPPRHALVIKERRATVSLRPGSAALRPGFRTPLQGLYLAGDWTATGFPATIEGAVLSGHACARLAAGA
ncbi:MAG TPA: hydroxysqualene dehydroxylase HpnE [Candidatus Cryosericum sp.]|nr:hydroxysqualene dehydroxylase HpnE [Candidatus Cryosericum sp.]